MNSTNKQNVFDQLVEGLGDSAAYSRGKLSLKSATLPPPPPTPKPANIVAMREEFNMSQALFAAMLNVSTKTVQAWEQGKRNPSHASARLLQVIALHPKIMKEIA